MTDHRSRRAFLRLGAAAGLGALAGCSGDTSSETGTGPTSDATPAPSPTPTPPDASATTATDPETEAAETAEATTEPAALPEFPDTIFRSDVRRTGYWPDRTVPDAVELDWTVPGINKGDHTAAKSSPLFYDGDLIVPGDVGSVFSFAPDATLNWATALHPSGFGTHATPAIAAGVVYTSAYDGAVYAIDAATGEMRWRTEVADAIGSSPAYYDGTLYVATEFYDPSGGMVALDAATGEVTWEDNRMTNHAHSITGVDTDTRTFAAGCNDGDLYVWDLDSREFRGRFETGGPIKGPVCIHDGMAVFGSWDDSVYAVDLADRSEVWRFDTGHDVMAGAAVDPDRDTVYIGGHDHTLRALDVDTGEQRWTYSAGGWIVGSPVVAGDTVLVGAYDDALHAVDAADGALRWEFQDPDGWVTSSPAVHDGNVYFTERANEDTTGNLYALSPA